MLTASHAEKQITDTTYDILLASNNEERGEFMIYFKSLAITAIAATLLSAGFVAPAQIGISIGVGVAPVCPTGTSTTHRIAARPTATTARTGSLAGCSSGPGRGLMARAAFTATSTTVTILGMVTVGPMPERGETGVQPLPRQRSARRARPRRPSQPRRGERTQRRVPGTRTCWRGGRSR